MKLVSFRNKLRLIHLVVFTAVTLLLLLNEECKPEPLQEGGSRTRQDIPETDSLGGGQCCNNLK